MSSRNLHATTDNSALLAISYVEIPLLGDINFDHLVKVLFYLSIGQMLFFHLELTSNLWETL